MGFMQINTKMSESTYEKKSMSDQGIREVSQNVLGRYRKAHAKKINVGPGNLEIS